MTDLIDRQAAIEVVNAVWCVTGDTKVAKIWDQIKALPSAERRGKWIKHANCRGGVFYECSFCNILRRNAATLLFKFCPNCGASMGKEWTEE